MIPEEYGARADGTADDTAALAAAATAATGGLLRLTPGAVYATRGLRLLPRTTLQGQGAALRSVPGTPGSLLTVTDGCAVFGVEIDGAGTSHPTASLLTARGGTGVSIAGVHLRDGNGRGLVIENVADYSVHDVSIRDVTGPGIQAIFSNRGRFSACSVDTAQHGIQLWGGDAGDAGVTSTIDSVEITGCQVSNVRGGIWASRGRDVTIVGNDVRGCSDVGIDFEGSRNCLASGNTVTNATHAGLAVFFASSDCTFQQNTVVQAEGMGTGFRAFGRGVSRRITVRGNRFDVADGTPCRYDATVLADSSVQCPGS